MINNKYNIILTDNPWSYKDKANSGKRGASHKYDTLSLEELSKLDVKKIAADDCCLFSWGTWPLINEHLWLLNQWDFKYKTKAFTWIKTNKIQQNTLFWGMGNWTRTNDEYCLLAIRGKPKRLSKSVHSIIMSPILKPHSRKPPETRDRIIKLCGDLPRIELFATEPEILQQGWDAIGYGIDGKDIRNTL